MKTADPTFRYLSIFVASLLGLLTATWLILRPGTLALFGTAPGAAADATAPAPTWEEQIRAVQANESDRIELSRRVIGDVELRQVSDLTGLRELIVERGDKVTNEGLAALSGLAKLDHLRLRGIRVSDEGLKSITKATGLKRLNLPQADLTDNGLQALTDLPNLELLRIGSPRVTDIGIAHVANLKNLRWLHLIDIPLGDASLKSIAAVPKLESLYIDGAKISDAAYEELFRSRPDLHIHVDQHHHDRDPHRAAHDH